MNLFPIHYVVLFVNNGLLDVCVRCCVCVAVTINAPAVRLMGRECGVL